MVLGDTVRNVGVTPSSERHRFRPLATLIPSQVERGFWSSGPLWQKLVGSAAAIDVRRARKFEGLCVE